MRVAICEDQKQDLHRLMMLLEAYQEAYGITMDITSFEHTDALLSSADPLSFDLLILDIMMGEDNLPYGVRAAHEARDRGYAGDILFTTASAEYYPQGFAVNAVHYLEKPVTSDALEEALKRVFAEKSKPERVYHLPVKKTHLEVPQRQIIYVEVYGHETKLYTPQQTLRVMLPLKKMAEMLSGPPFLKCFRSYIVNMDYIQNVEEAHFLLRNGTYIPIAVRNRYQIKEQYLRYHLRALGGGKGDGTLGEGCEAAGLCH